MVNSRGVGVALLHGIRDKRVRAVVAFAAPTQWFSLMSRPGEDWRTTIEAALGNRNLSRQTREHQFIEWFLQDREHDPLSEVRAKILASSPLYFVRRLPPTQLHHGEQDRPVPVVNSQAVSEKWQQLGLAAPDYRSLVYRNAGHDLAKTEALQRAREFLAARLSSESTGKKP